MKVKCGRCGAEYSEIRKTCPNCHEETKFAVYVEKQQQPPQPTWQEVKSIPLAPSLEPNVSAVQGGQIKAKKKKPIFFIAFLIGAFIIVGTYSVITYMIDRKEAKMSEPISIEKIELKQVLELENAYFKILGAKTVEHEVLEHFITDGTKVVAVEIVAVETSYEDSIDVVYKRNFYGYYDEDEYVEPIHQSGVLDILEGLGYPIYDYPEFEEEKVAHLFFLVDDNVDKLTVVYNLPKKVGKYEECIEKMYEIDLNIK